MTETFLYADSIEQAKALEPAGRPLADLIHELRDLYLEDARPWVIGFSGGKDSTAILQLVYSALHSLEPKKRHKQVFVVSSDTLVETPVVVQLLKRTLEELNDTAIRDSIPLEAHEVSPKQDQTFWVNLLGRGYPAPTKTFRWCTERMKINPINEFVLNKVAEFGEVIVVLGARSAESASRAQVIAKHRIEGTSLGQHTSLPNAYVYTPIKDWTADEVWEYLMSAPRPWGGDNSALLDLYKGSNAGECPIVIDTSTPSCGNSRFGCWTCTVVTTDKAMESLVQQGEDWMRPLLDFRNMLAETSRPERKTEFRNHRRRTGKISFARGNMQDDSEKNHVRKHVPGPYWMRFRKEWLERLLVLQRGLQANGHDIELIAEEELHQIRHQWLNDPNEPDWADDLPRMYRSVFGYDLQWAQHDAGTFNEADSDLLQNLESKYSIPATLVRKLLDLETSMDGLAKRRGMADRIHQVLTEDWEPLETVLSRGERVLDGGYQEEVERLQYEMETLADRISS
ncbi:MAG: DNA phosphorothioation system sulfurtransferase DndC [Gammaproteobacteria bacterium]|nr:DNA phosphorothioation system sulfurtransferase DndC [Gammaproteobacteria bacterium]